MGSSILILSDFESNEEPVNCTPGTMIEILVDRVGSTIGSPVEAICELNPNVVLVEPTLLENESPPNEADV